MFHFASMKALTSSNKGFGNDPSSSACENHFIFQKNWAFSLLKLKCFTTNASNLLKDCAHLVLKLLRRSDDGIRILSFHRLVLSLETWSRFLLEMFYKRYSMLTYIKSKTLWNTYKNLTSIKMTLCKDRRIFCINKIK